jgi:uncharacterized protein
MSKSVYFWRRVDVAGLERLELDIGAQGVQAVSSVLCIDGNGFRLDHHWQLDADWHAQSVIVENWNAEGHRRLCMQRDGSGWTVDGRRRPDLDQAAEPDLSVTPFCNTFVIRHARATAAAGLTVDVAYIDGNSMTVARSTQRYERLGPARWRYIDLGLSRGFEAELTVDEHGLVVGYEQLFERVQPKD